MRSVFDAFWRAAMYCLHPRVVALSVLPLILMVGLAFGLGYFFWDNAVEQLRVWLGSLVVVDKAMDWLDGMGLGSFRHTLPQLVIVLAATPLLIIVCLLVVASLMTPAMVSLVAERRFHSLERRHGGSFLGAAFGALVLTLVAIVLLLVSLPLWLIPPLVLVLPPLIWGWLTYRVLTYDVLADHASKAERATLVKRHRSPLLAMGVVTGYLGAAPSLVWASGAVFAVMAPVLVPVAIWIYTLVFAFSSLWFAHYALNALNVLRMESGHDAVAVPDALPKLPSQSEPPAASANTSPAAAPSTQTLTDGRA